MTTQIKIVLLGDTNVGKTSIVQRFALDKFNPFSQTTHGAAFICKSIDVPEIGRTVKFQIWDTAGQERYHSMASMYYQDAAAAIIVFDLTREDSFEAIKTWIKELREKGPNDILIVIAGNKSDLVEQQKVDLDKAREYADESNAQLMIVSAKEGINIKEIFTYIAKTLKPVSSAQENGAEPVEEQIGKKVRNSIKVTKETAAKPGKKGGCC